MSLFVMKILVESVLEVIELLVAEAAGCEGLVNINVVDNNERWR